MLGFKILSVTDRCPVNMSIRGSKIGLFQMSYKKENWKFLGNGFNVD
jgi:hypothetical protein